MMVQFNCAVNVVILPPSQDNKEEFEDMNESLFNQLKDRTPDDYDWSKNYVLGQAEKLTQLGKLYYERKTKSILENTNGMVELCDPIQH